MVPRSPAAVPGVDFGTMLVRPPRLWTQAAPKPARRMAPPSMLHMASQSAVHQWRVADSCRHLCIFIAGGDFLGMHTGRTPKK